MRILNLAIKDLRQILRDWKSAFFLVLMPIIFTLFFGIIFNQDDSGNSKLPVAYPAGAQSDPAMAQFIELLSTSNAIDFEPVEADDPQSLEARVADGDFAGAVTFASNFEETLRAQGEPALTLITDISTPAGQTVQESIEKAFERYRSALQIANLSADYYALKAPESDFSDAEFRQEAVVLAVQAWQQPPVILRSEMGGGSESQELEMGFSQSSPGMIVQFAIFGLITSAMVLVIERKSGAMARLLTTPLRRVELVGGHVLAMFLVVFVQQLILILLGQFAFNVNYAQEPIAILLMVLSLAFWAASLGLFIGAISESEEQVVTLSMIAMFVFAALGGAWFPLEFAGQTFSTIGHFMPTAWAMDGFQNVIVRGLGLNSVLLPAGLIAAYGAAFFALAVWRFRYE